MEVVIPPFVHSLVFCLSFAKHDPRVRGRPCLPLVRSHVQPLVPLIVSLSSSRTGRIVHYVRGTVLFARICLLRLAEAPLRGRAAFDFRSDGGLGCLGPLGLHSKDAPCMAPRSTPPPRG